MPPAKIYVVDDDDAVRDSLKLLLESYGFAVEDYPATADFARAYRPQARQCLILDQHLPGSTGLDFLAALPDRVPPRLPVIMVTGRGDTALRDRAAEVGVSAFLEKPVADETLLAAIRTALDGTSCRSAPSE